MDTMKNSLIAFSLVILLSFGDAAQSGTTVASNTVAEAANAKPADVQTPSVVPLIGAGTGLVAELSNNINAKKAKPGDRVKAQITQDVLYRGRIVMRVGTKLIGHVQAARPFTKDEQESQLNIVFDKAELKGGGEMALMGSIRALAPTVNVSMVDRPDQMAMPAVTGVQGTLRGPAPVGGGPSRTSGTGNRNTAPPTPTATSGSSAANASFSPAAMQSGHFTRDNRLLSSASRGVIGMRGITLTNSGTGPNQTSVISSNRDHVKLESGIQIVVQLNAPVTQ
jgi:hypothetical protein